MSASSGIIHKYTSVQGIIGDVGGKHMRLCTKNAAGVYKVAFVQYQINPLHVHGYGCPHNAQIEKRITK